MRRLILGILVFVILFLDGMFSNSSASPNSMTLLFPEAGRQSVLQGDPQKHSRLCFCQFGVGLRTDLPGFKIGQLLTLARLGHHSYGGAARREQNGQIYTCGGGFIDSTHLRAGIDWTAHLVVLLDRLTVSGGSVRFGSEGGDVLLVVHRSETPLGKEDLLLLAQRVAYERLTWHEVMSWYYHPPDALFSEQQSAFSPEDLPSNFLGTEIGRTAIEVVEATHVPFEDAVDQLISLKLKQIGAVASAKATRLNFAQVDRHQNGSKTGVAWYDSGLTFWDEHYLFKRNIGNGDVVTGWRLPIGDQIGCDEATPPMVGHIPALSVGGQRLAGLYEWRFSPDEKYTNPKAGASAAARSNLSHAVLPSLVTNSTLSRIVDQVGDELRADLGNAFDTP